MMHKRRTVLYMQGLFYVINGLWPLVHIQSFRYVLGNKTDFWLVNLVGLLSISIGVALIGQTLENRPQLILSRGIAISFLTIDTYYALNNTISDLYLIDAAIQLIFLILSFWCTAVAPKRIIKKPYVRSFWTL